MLLNQEAAVVGLLESRPVEGATAQILDRRALDADQVVSVVAPRECPAAGVVGDGEVHHDARLLERGEAAVQGREVGAGVDTAPEFLGREGTLGRGEFGQYGPFELRQAAAALVQAAGDVVDVQTGGSVRGAHCVPLARVRLKVPLRSFVDHSDGGGRPVWGGGDRSQTGPGARGAGSAYGRIQPF